MVDKTQVVQITNVSFPKQNHVTSNFDTSFKEILKQQFAASKKNLREIMPGVYVPVTNQQTLASLNMI